MEQHRSLPFLVLILRNLECLPLTDSSRTPHFHFCFVCLRILEWVLLSEHSRALPFLFWILSSLDCVRLTEHSRTPPFAVPGLYCRKIQAGQEYSKSRFLLRTAQYEPRVTSWQYPSALEETAACCRPALRIVPVWLYCVRSLAPHAPSHTHTQRPLFSSWHQALWYQAQDMTFHLLQWNTSLSWNCSFFCVCIQSSRAS